MNSKYERIKTLFVISLVLIGIEVVSLMVDLLLTKAYSPRDALYIFALILSVIFNVITIVLLVKEKKNGKN